MTIVGFSTAVGALMLMAGYSTPSSYGTTPDPLISQLFVLLMSIPAFLGMLRWLGVRRGITVLTFFGVLTTSVEIVAVVTGFPFGAFSYSEALGFKVLGAVPWTVPIAYLPILFGSYMMASNYIRKSRIMLVLVSSLLVILADLLLDPAAIRLMLWQWHGAGIYYGVPLSNYLGWLLTGLVYSSLLLYLMGNNSSQESVPLQFAAFSLLCIGGFWTGFSLATKLVVPTLAGSAFLSTVMISLIRGKLGRFPKMSS